MNNAILFYFRFLTLTIIIINRSVHVRIHLSMIRLKNTATPYPFNILYTYGINAAHHTSYIQFMQNPRENQFLHMNMLAVG